ncbi:hypothetical protein [Paenibacillus sp.]|uniref:hypothetical protein n=1 Tax=Paenibacillus sp. TaxID=58172 RepID=UPI0028B19A0A|nr:hypothetical protein [Paenibacillus sp.]
MKDDYDRINELIDEAFGIHDLVQDKQFLDYIEPIFAKLYSGQTKEGKNNITLYSNIVTLDTRNRNHARFSKSLRMRL